MQIWRVKELLVPGIVASTIKMKIKRINFSVQHNGLNVYGSNLTSFLWTLPLTNCGSNDRGYIVFVLSVCCQL